MFKKISRLVLISILLLSFNIPVFAHDKYEYIETSPIELKPSKDASFFATESNIMMEKENPEKRFTGWTTTKTAKYYYIDGVRVIGWRKINSSWYFFDESGKMVIGDYLISGQKYSFQEDGKWSGKRAKTAQKLDDFTLVFSLGDGDNLYSLDLEQNLLTVSEYEKTNIKKKADLSQADLQVIYSMYIFCDINKIQRKVTEQNILNVDLIKYVELTEEEPESFINNFPFNINIRVTDNGILHNVVGDDTAFLHLDNKVANRFCHFSLFMMDYIETLI